MCGITPPPAPSSVRHETLPELTQKPGCHLISHSPHVVFPTGSSQRFSECKPLPHRLGGSPCLRTLPQTSACEQFAAALAHVPVMPWYPIRPPSVCLYDLPGDSGLPGRRHEGRSGKSTPAGLRGCTGPQLRAPGAGPLGWESFCGLWGQSLSPALKRTHTVLPSRLLTAVPPARSRGRSPHWLCPAPLGSTVPTRPSALSAPRGSVSGGGSRKGPVRLCCTQPTPARAPS